MKKHFFHQLSVWMRRASANYFPDKLNVVTNCCQIDLTVASTVQRTKILLASAGRLTDEFEFVQMYKSFEQPEVE